MFVCRRKVWRNSRNRCDCEGYWFPHRRGGGACDHSKTRDIHRAIRGGDLQAIFEARQVHAEKYLVAVGGDCPF